MVIWLAGIFFGMVLLLAAGIGKWLKRQDFMNDDAERWHVQ